MQHTPDKEFDALFKNKLKGAEIEPPINLWQNIENEITQKTKNSFPFFWLATASIVLVISSFLLLKQKKPIYLSANTPAVTKLEKPVYQLAEITDKPQIAVQNINPKLLSSININPKIKKLNANFTPNKKDTAALQPKLQIARLSLQDPETKMPDFIPLNTNVIQGETTLDYTLSDIETEVLTNNTEKNPIDEPRKGIRNVGDLVNYVVDKVDKREKKFIKFNTDEDNSSIVGINIGFIKLNKRSRAER